MASSSRGRWTRPSAVAAVLLFGELCATPSVAQEQTYAFAIPPKSLAEALRDFGRVADRQLIFDDDLVAGRTAPRIAGDLSVPAALGRLLDGTDLAWRTTPTGTVMIVRKGAPDPQPVEAGVESGRLVSELPELTVVGSRIARREDGPAPVAVISSERIAALGASSVADVLGYLPQQTFALGDGFNVGGARPAQLRGLTAGTTLVLVNGRRVTPGGISVTGGYFDLNTVPLAAVDRIEVLADSASAVYGADAVGGVINLVLKSHIDRPVIEASYGAADGGADERRLSLSLGGETARTRGALILDYFQREQLLGFDRERTASADYRGFGGGDFRTPAATPGNICVASGLLPGLPTRCAAVPSGSTGLGLTPASFLATAGQRNLASPQAFASLVPEAERYTATATGEIDLNTAVSAFAEWMYADRRDATRLAPPSISNGLVAAANPFNPFGVPVRADFLFSGIGPVINEAHEVSHRVLLGLRGQTRRWDWEATALRADSDAHFQSRNRLDAGRVAAALAATTPGAALNVFQDGPGGPEALLRSLVSDPSTNASHRGAEVVQLGGFARGELITLPGGPLQAVIGAEWRREAMSALQPGARIAVATRQARRDSSSVYAEGRAPLGAGPGWGDLTLTLAGRYDRYSDFGGSANGQYGLEWRPRTDLLVRASYGESFRAPGLWSLFQPVTTNPTTLFDTKRSESTPVTVILGGNAGLEPEISTSKSFGVVWTPETYGRPRFSVSWWRIEQNLRILPYVTATSILANEATFPSRVVRAAPTGGDLAAGRPGQVLSVDARLVNVGSLATDGVDLEARAEFETSIGVLSPSLLATRVGSYVAADFPTTPAYQRVGKADFNGTVPRWKATGALAWRRGGVSATLTARYVSGYADTNLNVLNGARVKAQTLLDLQAAVRPEAFGRLRALDGITLRMGAVNLLDATPRYSGVTSAGYDPYQADTRGRYLYVALAKAF